MSNSRKSLGATGEKAAEKFLRAAGFRILTRNYTCPAGELDLICLDGSTIVFVEVKTRASDDLADPEANITPAKMRKLTQVARAWLTAHRHPDCSYRFDAVSVVLGPDKEPACRHIIEAFIPSR